MDDAFTAMRAGQKRMQRNERLGKSKIVVSSKRSKPAPKPSATLPCAKLAKFVTTQLVHCPCCERNVPSCSLNWHLDKCLQKKESPNKLQNGESTDASGFFPKADTATATDKPDDSRADESANEMPKCGESKTSTSEAPKMAAFKLMMESSKITFSGAADVTMLFLLKKDYSTTLSFLPSKKVSNQHHGLWSSCIISRSNSKVPGPTTTILLASECAGQDSPTRLVANHSTVSVPVLKSMLQKAIRRNMTHQSLHLTMELADKSLSDLLRRLPVIMIEDSMLHPDLPFLIWLMAASSKGFWPDTKMTQKILQIVQQMAAWKLLDDVSDELEESSLNCEEWSPFSYRKMSTEGRSESILSQNEVMVWSILMRRNYGGMAGDMKLLNRAAQCWHHRFKTQTLALLVQERVKRVFSKSSIGRWDKLISLMKLPVFASPEIQEGKLQKLSLNDFVLAGVDYHCSNVLNRILSDRALVTDIASAADPWASVNPNDVDYQKMCDDLKICMWKYSSGVNYRVKLAADTEPVHEDPWKCAWEKHVKTFCERFAKQYILSRLSRCVS